eukprot:2662031-Amphidinium_carterae.1
MKHCTCHDLTKTSSIQARKKWGTMAVAESNKSLNFHEANIHGVNLQPKKLSGRDTWASVTCCLLKTRLEKELSQATTSKHTKR